MLVTHILGDCPGCNGKSCFGNVSVRDDHVLRGCLRCKHHISVWLPEIRKKVLYLDQFFFSSAFRGGDPRFVEAADRVKKAASLQLLVAPYSSIHEDETHQWRGYKEFNKTDLLAFIKEVSGGAKFQQDYDVETTQVTKAWSAFLKGEPSGYVLEDDDAIEGPLDQWDDYFRIDVPDYFKDVELNRFLKGQSVDGLIDLFDRWQASTQTFDQDVAQEVQAVADNYLSTYITMIQRLARGDAQAMLDSPIVSQVVEQMLHWLPKDQGLTERLKQCAEFFRSEHFRQVPNLYISARMYATLKAMVKRGAYANREEARKRLNGFFEDVKHISLYAPYCNAFFMDQPMADLVRQPSVNLEGRYGVRVFSLNNLTEFFEWIDDLERGMSDDHKAGIEAAYPNRLQAMG
ncbi:MULTISPECIES: hypothetical protein [Pseudomonas]|uniref:hypothetical protein n=1 Tax=Pseudomonas TaxID=286 RepID=UPI000A1D617C|nr:hypothetical protein [Pseudomonas sp. B8(2017)]